MWSELNKIWIFPTLSVKKMVNERMWNISPRKTCIFPRKKHVFFQHTFQWKHTLYHQLLYHQFHMSYQWILHERKCLKTSCYTWKLEILWNSLLESIHQQNNLVSFLWLMGLFSCTYVSTIMCMPKQG